MHPSGWAAQTSAAVKLEGSGGVAGPVGLNLPYSSDVAGTVGLNLPFSGDVRSVVAPYLTTLEQKQYQHIQQGNIGLVGEVIDTRESDCDFSSAIATQQLDAGSLPNALQQTCVTGFEGNDNASGSLWSQVAPVPSTGCTLERLVNAAAVQPSSSLGLSPGAMKTESLAENRMFFQVDPANAILFDELDSDRTVGGSTKVEEPKISIDSSQFVRTGFKVASGHQMPLSYEEQQMPAALAAGGRTHFGDQIQVKNSICIGLSPQQQEYDLGLRPDASSPFLQMIETNGANERSKQKAKHDRDGSAEDIGRGKKLKETPGQLLQESLKFANAALSAVGPPGPPYYMGGSLPMCDMQSLGKLDVVSPGILMEENLTSMNCFRSPFPAAVDIEAMGHSRPKRRNVKISRDPQSVAARQRREKISDRMRVLQMLVPGGNKMDTASMLEEAIEYVKFLQRRVDLIKDKVGNLSNPTWPYNPQLGLVPGLLLRNPSVPVRGFSGNDCSSVSQGLASAPEQGLYGPGAPMHTFPSFAEPGRQQYSVCH